MGDYLIKPQAVKPLIEEKTYAVLQPPLKILAPAFIFSLIIPFLGWFILLPYTLWMVVVVKKTRYTITNVRVSAGRSIFRDNKIQIPIEQVANVVLHRGIWARLFHYGDITLQDTSGNARVRLKVSNATEVTQLLESLTPRARIV